MKLETILNAMIGTGLFAFEWKDEDKAKRKRQHEAFRAQILRVFEQGWCFQCGRREFDGTIYHTYDCKYSEMERQLAEKDKEIEQWEIYHGFHMGDQGMIETITEKDKRLDVLRAEYDFLLDGSKELKAELEEKEYQIYLHEQALAHQDAKIAEKDKRIDVLRAEYDFLLDEQRGGQ